MFLLNDLQLRDLNTSRIILEISVIQTRVETESKAVNEIKFAAEEIVKQ